MAILEVDVSKQIYSVQKNNLNVEIYFKTEMFF